MPRALLAGTCSGYDALVFRVSGLSDSQWDDLIGKFGAWSPHNYSGWAELKRLDGWDHLRIVDSYYRPISQVLTKTYRGLFTVAYSPGGFLSDTAIDARPYISFLSEELGTKLLYCRVHMLTPTRFKRLELEQSNWFPVSRSMSSGHSLKLRLDSTVEDRHNLLSYNWRRNLKRSYTHENQVELVTDPSPDEIADAHKDLERLKGKSVNIWESSAPHVRVALSSFDQQWVIVRCLGPAGNIRAVRGAVITDGGNTACDFLAATTEEGRKHYSSFATFWHLANELSRRGVIRYDLGGIDPQGNKGVFDFKNGTGAVQISYGGEFEATTPRLLLPLVSRLIPKVA